MIEKDQDDLYKKETNLRKEDSENRRAEEAPDVEKESRKKEYTEGGERLEEDDEKTAKENEYLTIGNANLKMYLPPSYPLGTQNIQDYSKIYIY